MMYHSHVVSTTEQIRAGIVHLRVTSRSHHSAPGPSGIGLSAFVWSNSGWRSLNVGGNWNNGSNAGVAYANGNNSFDNSNTNIGARLAYLSQTVSESITLGMDLASWQKNTTNDSRSAGKWGENSASEGRIEVDRQSQGLRL